ncbi:MoaD family protein [Natronococcus sp. A-GB1]|uniref:ubiquitin-like small modifier protein 1 n=1 Tax=Natronococcus sp. A-GB1 TaxID=3037648 RepID=UPI00241FE0DA|nr:ubiquitin-like small modifier protein 1 [Natronococcus sp. A-GB1]MDG5761043.1 MoaD family protein [Natronococcus sp. A-GB1]
MELELRYFAMIREAVGERTTTREFDSGTTVRDVLATLEDDHPDLEGTLLANDGAVARSITVLRNGTNVTHFEGGATELADGDTLSITPPVTGG